MDLILHPEAGMELTGHLHMYYYICVSIPCMLHTGSMMHNVPHKRVTLVPSP